MSKIISSLKFMQQMERLATNVYKYQISAFKGEETARKLQAAGENEKEHAATLAQNIVRLGSKPSRIGLFFGLAGGITGIITACAGKNFLLKTDVWIERRAIQDYKKFLEKNTYDIPTVILLNRIIGDEEKHIAAWTGAAGALQKK